MGSGFHKEYLRGKQLLTHYKDRGFCEFILEVGLVEKVLCTPVGYFPLNNLESKFSGLGHIESNPFSYGRMAFALPWYRYISLFAKQWKLAPGHPSHQVSEYPVETRCSRLLSDGVQCNIHLLSPGFESGFTGFSRLQRTSLFWVQWSFVEDYLVPFFSPMRNASARGFDMKVPFNNNLPTQTGDFMVNPGNPENPDSKKGR